MAVEVWWSTLTTADRRLLAWLDAAELARLEGLRQAADRGRSLVGAALLRVAAGSALGVDPADVVVDRTCAGCGAPHGAPRLVGPGHRRDLPWVSVSHSGLFVVVAVGDGPLGVDVQRVAVTGPPPPSPPDEWAAAEALAKACRDAPDESAAVVRALVPPLPGYVAALAAPDGAAVRLRTWPPTPTDRPG